LTDVICDLDGVLYRGDVAIEGVPDALKRLIGSGARLTFVTNNSTRTPANVALKIEAVTGVPTDPSQVVTSSQAAASMLRPQDRPVMIIGEDGVNQAISDLGMKTTEDPEEARCVVVGMYRDITYQDIDRAAAAVRSGARFVATNIDPTFPTERGFLPGSGALVAAISTAGGREPEIAGKPNEAIRELIRSRGVGEAWIIGDRLDTDIAMGTAEKDWKSVLVLTGVTAADEEVELADHVTSNFATAVDLVLSHSQRQ
jgi:HAD superfamily hydrolase (TIGR01450 family)